MNFIRELHCNLHIIRESELPDNMKVILFSFTSVNTPQQCTINPKRKTL